MFTLFILLLFAPSFVLFLVILNQILSVSNPDLEKISVFECGFSPINSTRNKINIVFIIVAILFMAFDVEVLYLYPAISGFKSIDLMGCVTLLIYFLIINLGLFIEIKNNILKFENKISKQSILSPNYNTYMILESIISPYATLT